MVRTSRGTPSFWAILPLVLLLAGCGGNAHTATPTPTLTPAQILSNASAALGKTQTVHFTLQVAGQTYIDAAHQIQLLSAQGDLVRPDRVKTDFKIKVLGGVTISTSLIIIGSTHWSTDLITGKWGPAPAEYGYDPSILFDNQGGIGPVMDRVTNAVKLPDETIRGRLCHHVQANVAQSIIGSLTDNSMQGTTVGVDLWIDAANFNLLRAKLAETAATGGRQPATWTLDLTSQGANISITPPV